MESEISIEQKISDKEKELQEVSKALSIVHSEMYENDKKILEIRIKNKELADAEQKARARLRIVSSELRVLKDEFWQSRGR